MHILHPWPLFFVCWSVDHHGKWLQYMPSTHPSRTQLVRCWVRHPSMRSFGKLFSHSNGVNSASVDQVDMLVSASLPSHKGMTSPWGVANRNSQLQWVTFTLPLRSFISYEGTPFVTWHITSYSTSLHWVFHFPFPLKHVYFLQHCVSWHQLNCARSSIIVALLSVHFTVGLVLCFSIGFFEAH